MSDGMGREFMYLSLHATNRYLIPNWGSYMERQYCFLYLGVAYLMSQKAASCVLYTESRNGVLLTDCLTLKLCKD